ncbi:MAG: glycosidase, partial [Anaerolineae bacterium]|nr:glycosidase [Anaerolineae bacterium]
MENLPIGALTSHPVMRRHPANPILTRRDVPYPAMLLFNPGVTKYQGKYVMVFRNDYGDFQGNGIFEGTNLGLAFSDDGVRWEVQPGQCFQFSGGERATGGIIRAYDPRLMVIDGRCMMTFAVDTLHGVRGGIAVTEDFATWEVLSLTAPDNRNLVLFPERIGG